MTLATTLTPGPVHPVCSWFPGLSPVWVTGLGLGCHRFGFVSSPVWVCVVTGLSRHRFVLLGLVTAFYWCGSLVYGPAKGDRSSPFLVEDNARFYVSFIVSDAMLQHVSWFVALLLYDAHQVFASHDQTEDSTEGIANVSFGWTGI